MRKCATKVGSYYSWQYPLINYPGVNIGIGKMYTSSIKMTKVKLIDDIGNFYSFISVFFILSEFSATEEIRLMVF